MLFFCPDSFLSCRMAGILKTLPFLQSEVWPSALSFLLLLIDIDSWANSGYTYEEMFKSNMVIFLFLPKESPYRV